MASSSTVADSSNEVVRVADVRPAKLGCKLVVAVVRLYELPNHWISKNAISMELVLQDREGDRIHCTIGREHVGIYKTVIRKNGIYSMKNFVIQKNVKPPRTTSHEYKLSVYMKTEVRTLASTTFEFSPFRFMPFPDIEAMPGLDDQHQIDCIGYVVAKEDPKNMVTKAGQPTTCMTLYLEDLERNKMKCTVFGDMVAQLVKLAARDDVQPLIVVAQLFKPSVYLNETYIQNTRYVSQVFLNPTFPEVIAFRNSLLAQREAATQGITHVESQPQYSVEAELEGGARAISSIEEVMNLTEKTTCWILAEILSVEGGFNSWCYQSCFKCAKKVVEVKNGYQCSKCKRIVVEPPMRYRLHVIVADGTGCLNLMIWNDEAKQIIGQSAKEVIDAQKAKDVQSLPKVIESLIEKKFLFKLSVSTENVNSMDQLYGVAKICDDEELIGIYSSAAANQIGGMDHTVSNLLPHTASVEADSQTSGGVVSLSMDSNSQPTLEAATAIPAAAAAKDIILDAAEDIVPDAGVGGLASPANLGSTNRPCRRGAGKRKFD